MRHNKPKSELAFIVAKDCLEKGFRTADCTDKEAADCLAYTADLIFELQSMAAKNGFKALSEKLSAAHMAALAEGARLRRN